MSPAHTDKLQQVMRFLLPFQFLRNVAKYSQPDSYLFEKPNSEIKYLTVADSLPTVDHTHANQKYVPNITSQWLIQQF